MRERTLAAAFDELHFAVEQLCIDIARDVRVQAFLGLLNGLLERDFPNGCSFRRARSE